MTEETRITLYYCPGSVSCIPVFLTAKALNLEFDLKLVDLFKQEQYTPEYLKLNPLSRVPTLVDGDFVLWESRTITRYLAVKYGDGGGLLYPQEPRARAIVDHRLDFDFGTLYLKFAEYFYPQILYKKAADEVHVVKLHKVLKILNNYLESSQYVAGADLTIADFAIVASVAAIGTSGFDLKPYSSIVRWFELMKSTEFGETIQENIDKFESILKQMKNGTLKWYRSK